MYEAYCHVAAESISYLGRLQQGSSYKNTQLLKIFSFDIQRSSFVELTYYWCSVSRENNVSGMIGLLIYIGVSMRPLDPRSYSWECDVPIIGCLEVSQSPGKNHWLFPSWWGHFFVVDLLIAEKQRRIISRLASAQCVYMYHWYPLGTLLVHLQTVPYPLLTVLL